MWEPSDRATKAAVGVSAGRAGCASTAAALSHGLISSARYAAERKGSASMDVRGGADEAGFHGAKLGEHKSREESRFHSHSIHATFFCV